MVIFPDKTPPDQGDQEEQGLDAAKRKLSEALGRPFDVDRILAADRAEHEREQKARLRAEQKLDQTVAKARQRRNEIRAQKVETENRTLKDKEGHVEAENRQFAKELEEIRHKNSPKPSPLKERDKPE